MTNIEKQSKQADLAKKLHPSRFTEMSGKMAAIVAYILNETWTEPAITDMCITSDGYVLAQHEDDIGMNQIIGSAEDLKRNWAALLTAAGLDDEEKAEAQRLFDARIKVW